MHSGTGPQWARGGGRCVWQLWVEQFSERGRLTDCEACLVCVCVCVYVWLCTSTYAHLLAWRRRVCVLDWFSYHLNYNCLNLSQLPGRGWTYSEIQQNQAKFPILALLRCSFFSSYTLKSPRVLLPAGNLRLKDCTGSALSSKLPNTINLSF